MRKRFNKIWKRNIRKFTSKRYKSRQLAYFRWTCRCANPNIGWAFCCHETTTVTRKSYYNEAVTEKRTLMGIYIVVLVRRTILIAVQSRSTRSFVYEVIYQTALSFHPCIASSQRSYHDSHSAMSPAEDSDSVSDRTVVHGSKSHRAINAFISTLMAHFGL